MEVIMGEIRIATTDDLKGQSVDERPTPEKVYAEDIVTTRTFRVSDLENQRASLMNSIKGMQDELERVNAKISSAQGILPPKEVTNGIIGR